VTDRRSGGSGDADPLTEPSVGPILNALRKKSEPPTRAR
jgi:hypothetical protein